MNKKIAAFLIGSLALTTLSAILIFGRQPTQVEANFVYPYPTHTPTPTRTPTPTPTTVTCHREVEDECVTHVFVGNHCPAWWSKGACPVVTPTPCNGEDCVTPTPEVTPEVTPTPVQCTGECGGWSPRPEGEKSTTEAPQCTNGSTMKTAANVHVLRNGTDATVNFFITEGDNAQVYWSVVGQPHWGNSSAGEFPEGLKGNGDHFVSYTIHNLDANQGYDFGIQQKNGCGGGEIETITSVVVDGPATRLFGFSYFELK